MVEASCRCGGVVKRPEMLYISKTGVNTNSCEMYF